MAILHTLLIQTDNLIKSPENDSFILIKWFYDNYLMMNADKSHLLVSKHDDSFFLKVDREIIEGSKTVRLLGITIDNQLDFTEHVSKICKKVSIKLHALARISNFMNPQKLRMLLIAVVFAYLLFVNLFISNLTMCDMLHSVVTSLL